MSLLLKLYRLLVPFEPPRDRETIFKISKTTFWKDWYCNDTQLPFNTYKFFNESFKDLLKDSNLAYNGYITLKECSSDDTDMLLQLKFISGDILYVGDTIYGGAKSNYRFKFMNTQINGVVVKVCGRFVIKNGLPESKEDIRYYKII